MPLAHQVGKWTAIVVCCFHSACASTDAGRGADAINGDAGRDSSFEGEDAADAGAPGADARSVSTDSGGSNVDAAPGRECAAVAVSAPATVGAVESFGYATFLSTPTGFVGVWAGGLAAGGLAEGYRAVELDRDGQPGSVATLWSGTQGSPIVQLALAGGVLALVDQHLVPENGRPICRLGLIAWPSLEPILEPAGFSGPVEDDSIIHEADSCEVAALGDDFFVVWRENTSRTSSAWSLYAMPIARDFTPSGPALTLASGGDFEKLGPISVVSDGARVIVAHGLDRDPTASLSFIENGSVRTVAVEGMSPDPYSGLELAIIRGEIVARNRTAIAVLDNEGRIARGPMTLQEPWVYGPLEGGFVVARQDEFLIASSLDASLTSLSEPSGISADRGAHLHQLVYAPDGSATAVLYTESNDLRFAKLECAAAPSAPSGPLPCREQSVIEPLDDGCSDPVCHAAIRFDFSTLRVLGYTTLGGPVAVVDAAGATEAARAAFQAAGSYLSPDIVTNGAQAGVFRAFMSPSDFGAFALVGEASGAVITAGGVVWDGRGNYWLPEAWQAAANLACGPQAATPAETFADITDCGAGAFTADDALDTALRTNLAANFAARGPFSAFTYLYTPSVGACDPGVAEYIVVLSQRP